jgi:hypothetical protein
VASQVQTAAREAFWDEQEDSDTLEPLRQSQRGHLQEISAEIECAPPPPPPRDRPPPPSPPYATAVAWPSKRGSNAPPCLPACLSARQPACLSNVRARVGLLSSSHAERCWLSAVRRRWSGPRRRR